MFCCCNLIAGIECPNLRAQLHSQPFIDDEQQFTFNEQFLLCLSSYTRKGFVMIVIQQRSKPCIDPAVGTAEARRGACFPTMRGVAVDTALQLGKPQRRRSRPGRRSVPSEWRPRTPCLGETLATDLSHLVGAKLIAKPD
jgi:hypothetical protein